MLFKQMIRPYNHHNTYIILFLISFFMIFSSKFFFPPPSSYKYIWIVLFCLFRQLSTYTTYTTTNKPPSYLSYYHHL